MIHAMCNVHTINERSDKQDHNPRFKKLTNANIIV